MCICHVLLESSKIQQYLDYKGSMMQLFEWYRLHSNLRSLSSVICSLRHSFEPLFQWNTKVIFIIFSLIGFKWLTMIPYCVSYAKESSWTSTELQQAVSEHLTSKWLWKSQVVIVLKRVILKRVANTFVKSWLKMERQSIWG